MFQHCRRKRQAKRREEYAERDRQKAEFLKQAKTLEQQDNNPYAYSFEKPRHALLVDAKTHVSRILSTLNLLASVPYRSTLEGPGWPSWNHQYDEKDEAMVD